jgi:hypothetical protein
MIDSCQCSAAGWCEKLQRNMTPHLLNLCQTSPEYRSKFAGNPTPKNGTKPCVHRGEEVKKITCDLCGMRGKQVEVYACDVRGECTLRRAVIRNAYAICLICPEFAPVGKGSAGAERLVKDRPA